MTAHTPSERRWIAILLVTLLAGCQQVDQTLPFELDPNDGATVSIGSNGGVVTLPPSFAISFPSGSYSGSVSVQPRIDEPFPSDGGIVVPGTAYDIGPAGTPLAAPARVEFSVPPDVLGAGDEVRLGLALLRSDQTVATFTASYDVTNRILTAEIDELGPVAVVLLADAIPVSTGAPPNLSGGAFSPPGPAPPGPGPSQASQFGGVEFSAACSPDARRCFSSGIIRVWADETIRERLGDVLYLVDARVVASLDFHEFNGATPEMVYGFITVGGQLRARLNAVVTNDELDETESTGLSIAVDHTGVSFVGGQMVLAETSDGFDTDFDYFIDGIGTTELLVVRIEMEVEFDNDDGSVTTGIVTADVRLRR